MKRLLPWALFLATSPAWGAFAESVTGGRAAALDGALTAAPGDVFSLYYNPAGLMDLAEPEAGLYYGRLFKGISDGSNISRSFFGWASPFRGAALGVSYGAYGLDRLYTEETVSVAYARRLGPNARWGATLKHFRRNVGHDATTDSAIDPLSGTSFGAEDPVYSSGKSAEAWDVDGGALWRLDPRWRVGVFATNLLGADVGLASEDRVPQMLKGGASYDGPWGRVVLDLSRRGRAGGEQTRVHGGLEKSLNRFAVRCGGGFGENNYARVAAGFSARVRRLRFDYGFWFPLGGVKDTSGSHQVSFVLGFGSEEKRAAP
ncbi:MAG: hypothetical protein IPP35_01825 [Elusimicrobia bacterium]|nr:hypothetical protein [Elusimicrobiota bacterium]